MGDSLDEYSLMEWLKSPLLADSVSLMGKSLVLRDNRKSNCAGHLGCGWYLTNCHSGDGSCHFPHGGCDLLS